MMKVSTKVLFLCFPEYGASNIRLAVIDSLQALHGEDVEIHMASLAAMAPKCPANVTFHQVRGTSVMEYLVTGPQGFVNHPEGKNFFSTSTTFWGYIKSVLNLPLFFALPPTDEYIETARDFEQVIKDVDPDVVVVDPAFPQCRDAAIASKRKVIILSPGTIGEHGLAAQGGGVFNFPAGLPYPLTSIWMKLRNIVSMLFIALYLPLSARVRNLNRVRSTSGYPGPLPPLQQVHEGPTLCMTTPSLDRPMVIPKDLFCIGPILRSAFWDPQDPIVQWINKAPTVFVNLGSISRTSKEEADVIYLALGVLLRQKPDIKVLWKLAKRTDYTLPENDFDGRLRIVPWLDVDPGALLRSGKIVCSVNHGGSNSYHEAMSAGVPQVICSAWYDCHDFAARLAELGIGKWGNKTSTPGVKVHELANALLEVVGSNKYSIRASAVAVQVRQHSETTWTKLFDTSPSTKGEVEGKDIAAEFVYRTATGETINSLS